MSAARRVTHVGPLEANRCVLARLDAALGRNRRLLLNAAHVLRQPAPIARWLLVWNDQCGEASVLQYAKIISDCKIQGGYYEISGRLFCTWQSVWEGVPARDDCAARRDSVDCTVSWVLKQADVPARDAFD